jgi:hypothetical protein
MVDVSLGIGRSISSSVEFQFGRVEWSELAPIKSKRAEQMLFRSETIAGEDR